MVELGDGVRTSPGAENSVTYTAESDRTRDASHSASLQTSFGGPKTALMGFNTSAWLVLFTWVVSVSGAELLGGACDGQDKALFNRSDAFAFPRCETSIGDVAPWTRAGLASKNLVDAGFIVIYSVRSFPLKFNLTNCTTSDFGWRNACERHSDLSSARDYDVGFIFSVARLKDYVFEDSYLRVRTFLCAFFQIMILSLSGYWDPIFYGVNFAFACGVLLVLWFCYSSKSRCDIIVQWDDPMELSASDWWKSRLCELYPQRNLTLTEDREGALFCVKCVIPLARDRGHIVLKARSRRCYDDAWATLCSRLPQFRDMEVQGIERLVGLVASPYTRFVKELIWFIYDFRRAKQRFDRILVVLRWIDRLDDIAQDLKIKVDFGFIISEIRKFSELSGKRAEHLDHIDFNLSSTCSGESDASSVGSSIPDSQWFHDCRHIIQLGFEKLGGRADGTIDGNFVFKSEWFEPILREDGSWRIKIYNPCDNNYLYASGSSLEVAAKNAFYLWFDIFKIHDLDIEPPEMVPQGHDNHLTYLNEVLRRRKLPILTRADFKSVNLGLPHAPVFFMECQCDGVNFELAGDPGETLVSCRVRLAEEILAHFGESMQPQGPETSFNSLTLLLKGVFNSSSIRAVLRLVTLVWHVIFVFRVGKVDWQHLAQWETLCSKEAPESVMNLGAFVVDQINILASCAGEFFATRDPLVFLRNDTEVTRFLEDVEKLVAEVKNLPIQATLPANIQDLENRIQTTIREGEILRPRVKVALRSNFTSGLLQLRSLALEVATVARSCVNRSAPFTVLMVGAPKIGKSSITNLMMSQFQRTNPRNTLLKNGLQLHSDGVYTRTLKEEYWSCYMNSHWGIIYDDLGQTNPKCPDFALEINEIVQVVNNAAFFPNMAGVDEKGKRYVAPQIVIANSNNRDLNAVHAVRSPGAVLRRFPYVVTPRVKTEFQSLDGSLDSLKARGYFDIWEFQVEKVVLVNRGQNVEYRILHTDLDTAAFLAWFNKVSFEHFEQQSATDDFTEKVKTASNCKECGVLEHFCRCGVPTPIVPQGLVFLSASVPVYLVSFLCVCCCTCILDAYRRVVESPLTYFVQYLFARRYMDTEQGSVWSVWNWATSWCEPYVLRRQCFVDMLWIYGWHQTSARINRVVTKSKAFVSRHQKIITVILLFTASAVFLHFVNKTLCGECSPQWFDDLPTGEKPEDAQVNVQNVWRFDKMPVFSSFLSTSSQTTGAKQFENMIQDAMGTLMIDGMDIGIAAFNVFGQQWLVPRHFAEYSLSRRMVDGCVNISLVRRNGLGSTRCKIYASDIVSCPKTDFSLVRLSSPPGLDMLPFLTTMPRGKAFSARLVLRRDGQFCWVPTGAAKHLPLSPLPPVSALNGLPADTIYSFFSYDTSVETKSGDCGSPVVICEDGRCAIVGFHVGVQPNLRTKLAMDIPIDWLKLQRSPGGVPCIVQGCVTYSKLDGTGVEVCDDLHPKCPLNFEGMRDGIGSSIIALGRFLNIPLHAFSSKVRENIFAPFWTSLGFVTDKIRPFTGPRGCPAWLPKRNFLLNATTHKTGLDRRKLQLAAEHYKRRLREGLPLSEVRKLCVVDEETNLYGKPGSSFINAMEFDTGAGFPHNVAKSKVMDPCFREGFPHGTFRLRPEMRTRIAEAEKKLASGVRPGFVFNSSLKDEPISEKKLALGKIRVFQAICIEGLFLLRKYFITLIALFQNFNFVTEAAIGMDATGPDWDDIHNHLNKPGWKIFCGDYSNYDQRMGSDEMLAAWGVLIDLAEFSGRYCSVSLLVMRTLASECCFPMVNFFGDFLLLNGTNPSGHALTVVINSIVNSIYLRYAWIEIFGDLDGFDDNVRIMTYGDDNIVSVSPQVQDLFNQVTVTNALAKVGLVYTDAAKSGNDAKPFCDEGEISFLKRSFVRGEEGFIRAPLELKSIHKMLLIGVHSSKVQEEDRLSSVLLSSLLEMFQYGRDAFNEHRSRVVACADSYCLMSWIAAKGGFPSYDDILNNRLAKVSRKSMWDAVANKGL